MLQSWVFRPWSYRYLEVKPCYLDKARRRHLPDDDIWIAATAKPDRVNSASPLIFPESKSTIGVDSAIFGKTMIIEFLGFDPAARLQDFKGFLVEMRPILQ